MSKLHRPVLLGGLLLLSVGLLLLYPDPETPGERQHRDAIYWAADYLVSTQTPDGGWDLEGTGAAAPGSRAAVGRSLLWAQNVTESAEHLAAVIHAAQTLVEELRHAPRDARALDGVFLEEVGRVTGDVRYRDAAHWVHQVRRLRHGWSRGQDAARFYHRAGRRPGEHPLFHRNLALWRALDDIQLAAMVGQASFAEEMARELFRGMELDPDHPAGALAAGRAVEVLGTLPSAPFEPRIEDWLGRLQRAQARPGVVPGEVESGLVAAQEASSVLLGFIASRDQRCWELAREGSSWFVDRQLQGRDGSWSAVLALGPEETMTVAGPTGVTADVLLALARNQRRELDTGARYRGAF